MRKGRDPYGVVLRTLREQVTLGDLAAGHPLPINDLATQSGYSATPVREALARLAGEGIIDDARGQGYRTWQPNPGELADAYDAHEVMVLAALGWTEQSSALRRPQLCVAALLPRYAQAEDDGRELTRATHDIFEQIVARARNEPLRHAHAGLNARLGSARRLEARCLPDVPEELALMATACDVSAADELEDIVRSYHARRRQIVQRLSATLEGGGRP